MGAGAIIAGVIGAAGLTATLIGNAESAKAQEELAREDQEIKNLQADEIVIRSRLNDVELKRVGDELTGRQLTGFARSGVGGASTFLFMARAAKQVARERLLAERDANFRAGQLRRGADIAGQLGEDIGRAGRISTIGTLLTGTARLADSAGAFDKNDKTTAKLGRS